MKKYLFITFGILFVYMFILALQGFDLCDEGFVLTFYQQIFHAPETVEYQFLYYLSGLVGGVWNMLFGSGGILSFRILSIIIYLFIIYITYLTVRKYMQPKHLLFAALFVILPYFGITVFHHNELTAFLVTVSVYFILKGLNSKNGYINIFLGAFFIGVNIFSRIPNVTMIGLGLLLFVDYFYEKNNSRLWKNILYSLCGFISGISLMIAIMFLCGHLEIFRQSVVINLLDAGTGSGGTHDIFFLLQAYFLNYKNVYTNLSIFVFTIFFFLYIYNFSTNQWLRLFSITSFIFIYILVFDLNNEKYYSLILFPLLISCFVDRANKPFMLLNTASLLVMFLLPLGSDLGIRNMGGNCIWLGTFVSIIHVFRFINYQIETKRNYSYKLFLNAFFVVYLVTGLFYTSHRAYFDNGSRLEKRYRADNSKFTVFTSKDKAEAMNELLSVLNKYVEKDDYLLAFESLPMINYLTETKPYIGNPWVRSYTFQNFKKHLDQAVATIPLPVVLEQKCQPVGGNWTVPDTADKSSNPFIYSLDRIEYFEAFLRNNNYKIVWENDLFAIYAVNQ